MSRVVVTGGAGFLGSHLCESLVGAGDTVLALDNFGSGRRGNVAHIAGGFAIREHDIREPIGEVVERPVETIYHFASRASPQEFSPHAVAIAETNAIGTANVLRFAADADATVVLASTSEVYGDPEVHPQPEGYRGHVNPRGPRAPYNEAKRFLEALGVAYHDQHGLDVRTVRIFNTYGPRLRPTDGRVVPTFLTQALAGEPLTVHGTGEQTRSFCYVDDLVRGVRAVAAAPGLAGEVVNLGSTAEISIAELAHAVVDVTDSASSIDHVDRPRDDPEVRQPDISRAKRRLGWQPRIPLREGLARTAAYFDREHPPEATA